LDTNIWSYIASEGTGSDPDKRARIAGNEIVVSPAVVDEVQQMSDLEGRRRLIQLLTGRNWKRLIFEIFSECAEVKSELTRRLRNGLFPSQIKMSLTG